MARTRSAPSFDAKGGGGLFLRNHWYVAAWADEIGRTPLARVILGDYLVLFRAEDGTPVALENRCPHRNLPLSEGRLVGDTLECGYHGLVFDCTGTCIHAPGEVLPPAWARVRAYPVLERRGWVMIWMGDPARADPGLAPDFHIRLGEPGWLTHKGYINPQCGYRLILDNLLDLSHLAYVHGSTTGNRALAEQATVSAEVEGDRVRVTRWMADIPPAKAFVDYAGYRGNIDRWQLSEYTPPSYIYVNSGTDAAGSGAPPAARRDSQGSWGFVVYHALTPESARTTHQFWSIALEEHLVPDAMRAEFERQMLNIPREDVAIYEAQQRAIDLDPEARDGDVRPRGMIAADKGLFAMRRILLRLYAAEHRQAA